MNNRVSIDLCSTTGFLPSRAGGVSRAERRTSQGGASHPTATLRPFYFVINVRDMQRFGVAYRDGAAHDYRAKVAKLCGS
jgi:hypothetical protein